MRCLRGVWQYAQRPPRGDWLTQINWIIKIFCGICGARSDVKETLAEIAEEIINLLNQINLRETYAVCDEGVLQYAPTGQG